MVKEGNGSGTLSFGNDHEYEDEDANEDPHDDDDVDDDEEDDVHDGGDGHEKMMCERDGLG